MTYTCDPLKELLEKTAGDGTYCGRELAGVDWKVDEWEPAPAVEPLRYRWPVCPDCLLEKGGRQPEDYVVDRWKRGLPILERKWHLHLAARWAWFPLGNGE